MKTRHLELSRNIKVEENRAWKGRQRVARSLDQKPGKRQNRLMSWQKYEAISSVSWYTIHSHPLSSLSYKYPLIFLEKYKEKMGNHWEKKIEK